jgi:hypothetical protein
MSFIDDILEKLGLKKPELEPKDALSKQTRSTPASRAAEARGQVKPISEVDVVKKLEELSGGNDNWKVSIVELLSLLKIDSSREARNEMAVELGCPPELMSDSAKMNIWLHKEVLRKIAQNGGNIPPSLLD